MCFRGLALAPRLVCARCRGRGAGDWQRIGPAIVRLGDCAWKWVAEETFLELAKNGARIRALRGRWARKHGGHLTLIVATWGMLEIEEVGWVD